MKISKLNTIAVLILVAACGSPVGTQIVDFPEDGGTSDAPLGVIHHDSGPKPPVDSGKVRSSDTGVTPPPGTDASEDSNTAQDAGVDSGSSGSDAGSDAGSSSGSDAGSDTGTSTGSDAGTSTDSGTSTGSDSGSSSGSDSGVTTGGDSGTSTGSDAGTPKPDAGSPGTDAGSCQDKFNSCICACQSDDNDGERCDGRQRCEEQCQVELEQCEGGGSGCGHR